MNWDLTVVTDSGLRPDRTHLDICRAAIAGGAGIIQLRDKTAADGPFLEWGRALKKETMAAGRLLVINDRVDVAVALGTALHLGQDDLPIDVARQMTPPGTIIGVTVTTPAQAMAAQRGGADYVSVSPIFEARGTKPDAGEPGGLELLRQVRAVVSIPVIAIGGIKIDNLASVIATGADGIAVVSAVVCAKDMVAATRQLVEGVREAKLRRR